MDYRILFLNITRKYRSNLKNSGQVLGQHILASILLEHGYNTGVFNGYTSDIEKILEIEISKNNTKAIGLYCDYDNLSEVISISSYIKSKYNVFVFVGGPQAIALNEDFLLNHNIDMIIEGESEIAILELANYLTKDSTDIKSISNAKYINRKTGKMVVNRKAEIICDLDTIPYPKYEVALNRNFRRDHTVSILTGRGCPFACTFCYEGTNSKKVRFRSVDNVIEEIKYIIDNNEKLKYILFVDDTFTIDIKRVISICKNLKKLRKGKNFYWFCEAHINTLINNPEILTVMVESGLIRLQLGIESGSNKMLKLYNKNIDREKILKVLDYCYNAGVKQVVGNIIIGGPYESNETIQESIDFVTYMIRRYNTMLDISSIFFAPYPNTPITNNPNEFGMEIIDSKNLKELLSMEGCINTTAYLSKNEIVNWKKKFDIIIGKEMEKVICSLPKHKIFELIKFNELDIPNYWSIKINEFINIKEYFYLNGLESFKSFEELDSDEFLKYRPLRVCSLDDINISYNISDLEMTILEYSTGKMTNIEIIKLLNIKKEYVESIKSLNDKLLIIFSKF